VGREKRRRGWRRMGWREGNYWMSAKIVELEAVAEARVMSVLKMR
jgi:hypothetical protein